MPAKANSDRADLENLLAQVAENMGHKVSYELDEARRKVNEPTLEDQLKTETKVAPKAA